MCFLYRIISILVFRTIKYYENDGSILASVSAACNIDPETMVKLEYNLLATINYKIIIE